MDTPIAAIPTELPSLILHGTSGDDAHRTRGIEARARQATLEYVYAGQSPDVKRQIVDMALNASGIRDTARVSHVSPTTVIKELKKRHLTPNK